MPIVTTNLWEEGDVPTAAQLNAPYNDAQTATADIDSTNTKDNWITVQHFDNATPCNILYDFVYDGTSEFSTSSTSYVVIDSFGGDPTDIVLNYQPNQYEVLRVEASGLVTDTEAVKTYDNTLPVGQRGNPNYYAFQILLYYNVGGPTLTVSLGEWGYSFTSVGGDGRYYTAVNGAPENTGVPLAYQTFQFSTTFGNTLTAGSITYEKLELRAKVYDGANTLKISRNNLIAVRARH